MTDWPGILSDYRSWLRIERSLSPNTVASYLSDIAKLREMYPERGPETLSGEDLSAFLSSEVEHGISKRSQSRMVSSLKSFYGFLEIEGRLSAQDGRNPAETIDSPKISRHIPTVLSVEEVKRILESVDLSTPEGHRNRAILEVLYSCGLRVSEVVSLRISDLFLEDSFIRVIGKGDKQRLVPIGEPAAQAVQLYLSQTRRAFASKKDEDILFLNRRGGKLSRSINARQQASPRRYPPTPSATPSPPISSRTEPTSAPYSRCSGTRAYSPPRSTPTSTPASGSAPSSTIIPADKNKKAAASTATASACIIRCVRMGEMQGVYLGK